MRVVLSDLRANVRLIPGAVVSGAAFGLFASGYWLIDLFPVGSRLLILLAGLLALIGAAGSYWLLRWAQTPFAALSGQRRGLAVALSLLAGAALFFGGTSRWMSQTRYVPFFLPSHHLRVSVEPGQAAAGDVRVLWFSTSLGDVSYDTIQMRGWKRAGDELVLVNASDNSLEWVGRTGADAELVFRSSSEPRKALIQWDSSAETASLAPGKSTYQKTLDVPWFASRALVLVLGTIVFSLLALGLLLLLWQKRADLKIVLAGISGAAGQPLDRIDIVLVLSIMLLALLPRLLNLGTLFPAVDEYYHLIAARQLTEGAALSSVYPRGLWIVTVPVSLALRVFGYQLWAARLVGALFNVLAIVPLYLLTHRINRPVAVLSSALFATSPWIVTFARIAREYAFYPFYFYWILFAMVLFIQAIPQDAVLARDWKAILTPKLVLLGAALILPPLFALYGDRLSTFRTIILAYPIFGLFVLARFKLKDRSNWPFLAVLGAGLLVASYFWYQRQKAKILPFPRYNSVPVEYFLPNPSQQWYFGRLVLLVVAGILIAAFCCYLLRRSNFIPLLITTLFAGYLGFFALFSMTFFHTRHLLTTELWYVILVAMGLYFGAKALAALVPWRGGLANVVLAGALGLSVINASQVILPAVSTNPDDPISEDYLHDLSSVHTYMLDHVQQGDVLVSTVYGLYSSWREEPRFRAQYRITSQTPPDEILSLIDQHPSGWIVIDQIRLSLSALSARDFAGIADVHYVGQFGDEYVWHWQHASGGQGSSTAVGKGP